MLCKLLRGSNGRIRSLKKNKKIRSGVWRYCLRTWEIEIHMPAYVLAFITLLHKCGGKVSGKLSYQTTRFLEGGAFCNTALFRTKKDVTPFNTAYHKPEHVPHQNTDSYRSITWYGISCLYFYLVAQVLAILIGWHDPCSVVGWWTGKFRPFRVLTRIMGHMFCLIHTHLPFVQLRTTCFDTSLVY